VGLKLHVSRFAHLKTSRSLKMTSALENMNTSCIQMRWVIAECNSQMEDGSFSYKEGNRLMKELDLCLERVQLQLCAYIENIKHERRERRYRQKRNRRRKKETEN